MYLNAVSQLYFFTRNNGGHGGVIHTNREVGNNFFASLVVISEDLSCATIS
jgi:hypothetical protein